MSRVGYSLDDYYRDGWNGQTGMGVLLTQSVPFGSAPTGSFTETSKHPGLTFPGWLVSKGHLAINDQVSPMLIRSLYLQYVSAKAGVSPETWLKSDGLLKRGELPAFSDPSQTSIPIFGMAGRPLARAPYLQFSGKEDLSTLSGLRVAWNFLTGVRWAKWVKSSEDKAAMEKAAEKAAIQSVLTGKTPAEILPTLATPPATQTPPYVPPVYAPPLSPPPPTQTPPYVPPVYYPPVQSDPIYSLPEQDIVNSYQEPPPVPSGGFLQSVVDWFTGASTEPAPEPSPAVPPSAAPQVAPVVPTVPGGSWVESLTHRQDPILANATTPTTGWSRTPPAGFSYTQEMPPRGYHFEYSPTGKRVQVPDAPKAGITTATAGMTVASAGAGGMSPMVKLALGVGVVGAVMILMRRKKS